MTSFRTARNQLASRVERVERAPAMATTINDQITELCALINAHPERFPRGTEFALSLVGQFQVRGMLSPRQEHFVGELLRVARTPRAVSDTITGRPVPMGGTQTVFGWLTGARGRRVLRPALTYRAVGGNKLRIFLPSATSRYAGSSVLFVKWNGDYAGRVEEGNFIPARDCDDANAVYLALCVVFGDPLAEAVATGHQSGACCFCARELTDPRSVSHGYGPICADNYGLPWDAVREPSRPSIVPPSAAVARMRATAVGVADAPAIVPVEAYPGLDAEDMEFMR